MFISDFVSTFIREQRTKDVSNYLFLQQTGHTALMLAAKAGHLNVVKKLITSGARLDITDKVNSLSKYTYTAHSCMLNMWQCCIAVVSQLLLVLLMSAHSSPCIDLGSTLGHITAT